MADRDAQFFFTILSSMKNKPEVDWAAVAAKSGLKNGKVAATRFGQIKKKIDMQQIKGDGEIDQPPKESKEKKEKKSPRKRKVAVKVEENAEEENEDENEEEDAGQPSPSPSKRPRFEDFEDAKEVFDAGDDFDDGLDYEDV